MSRPIQPETGSKKKVTQRLLTPGELQAQLEGALAGIRQRAGNASNILKETERHVAKIRQEHKHTLSEEEKEDLLAIIQAFEEVRETMIQAGQVGDRIQKQIWERSKTRVPALQYVVGVK